MEKAPQIPFHILGNINLFYIVLISYLPTSIFCGFSLLIFKLQFSI